MTKTDDGKTLIAKRMRVRRGNSADAEDMKHALIRATSEIFQERGLDAVTMRSVAARVGVADMTPYTYFENKQSLLLESIKDKMYEELKKVQAIAASKGSTARERLREAIVVYMNFWETNPDLYRVVYVPNSKYQPPIPGAKAGSLTLQGVRNLSIDLTKEIAREIGGQEDLAESTVNFRYFGIIGFMHARVTGQITKEQMNSIRDSFVDQLLDATENILLDKKKKSQLESRGLGVDALVNYG